MNNQSILTKLEEAKIFSVSLNKDNTLLEITEACDGFFQVNLTEEAVLELIEELKQLREKMK